MSWVYYNKEQIEKYRRELEEAFKRGDKTKIAQYRKSIDALKKLYEKTGMDLAKELYHKLDTYYRQYQTKHSKPKHSKPKHPTINTAKCRSLASSALSLAITSAYATHSGIVITGYVSASPNSTGATPFCWHKVTPISVSVSSSGNLHTSTWRTPSLTGKTGKRFRCFLPWGNKDKVTVTIVGSATFRCKDCHGNTATVTVSKSWSKTFTRPRPKTPTTTPAPKPSIQYAVTCGSKKIHLTVFNNTDSTISVPYQFKPWSYYPTQPCKYGIFEKSGNLYVPAKGKNSVTYYLPEKIEYDGKTKYFFNISVYANNKLIRTCRYYLEPTTKPTPKPPSDEKSKDTTSEKEVPEIPKAPEKELSAEHTEEKPPLLPLFGITGLLYLLSSMR